MSIRNGWRRRRAEFLALSFYERFEYVVVVVLTALIAIVVVAAVWNLVLEILIGLVFSGSFDPSDHSAFQAVFGMIFTVIIALEFKRSLLVVAARRDTVLQMRSVVVIALLALGRKIIILDLAETDALQIIALAAVIVALGAVYWLVGNRGGNGVGELPDRSHRQSR